MIRHGVISGYTYHRCRCADCTEAARVHVKRWMAKLDPADAPHGTRNGYISYRCRCAACTAANTAYMRKWRARVEVSA